MTGDREKEKKETGRIVMHIMNSERKRMHSYSLAYNELNFYTFKNPQKGIFVKHKGLSLLNPLVVVGGISGF